MMLQKLKRSLTDDTWDYRYTFNYIFLISVLQLSFSIRYSSALNNAIKRIQMNVLFFVHLQKYILEFYGNFQSVIKNPVMSAQKILLYIYFWYLRKIIFSYFKYAIKFFKIWNCYLKNITKLKYKIIYSF